jgi:hypothetical protein
MKNSKETLDRLPLPTWVKELLKILEEQEKSKEFESDEHVRHKKRILIKALREE